MATENEFSYLVLSANQSGQEVWLISRFRHDDGRTYFHPIGNDSAFSNLMRDWTRSQNKGTYDSSPLSYYDYLLRSNRYNSHVDIGGHPGSPSLWLNRFENSSDNATSVALNRLHDSFTKAIDDKDVEAFKKLVSSKSFNLQSSIFELGNLSAYNHFKKSFAGLHIVSYLDLSPLFVVYLGSEGSSDVFPMYAKMNSKTGEYIYVGIGKYSSSFNLFRSDVFKDFVRLNAKL